jgi:pseudaminic acid biosynthesis-associated methylase
MTNRQEEYWQGNLEYMERNHTWDLSLGVQAWNQMLAAASLDKVQSVLEIGCNIGRNLRILSHASVLPQAKLSGLDVNQTALRQCMSNFNLEKTYHSSLASVEIDQFYDLVFTSGVLIHIHPDNLKDSISKLIDFSRRYVLVCEYFSRSPVEIEYRGQSSLLWKRDFGKYIVEEFQLRCLDYGFLWGYEYDDAGFDDVTYWLFER